MSVLVYIAIGLESFVKRRVDIVSIDHVELLLKHTVLNYGELIYCRDYKVYVRDKWMTTLLWLDFKNAYERMHKSVVKSLLGDR